MSYKILMVAPTSFFSDNGCHVRIAEEAWLLQEAGHRVVICTYHMGNEIEGVELKRSLDVPWKRNVQVGSSRHKLYFDAMLGLRSLQTTLTFQPDIIHAHLHEGALIGWFSRFMRFNKTPLVFDFQGSLTSEMVDHRFLNPKGKLYKPTLKLEKMINRMPDKIITSTHNGQKLLTGQFNVPAGKVVTVPDRVNSERFHPAVTAEEKEFAARLKAQLGIPAERKVVVYLGVLAPYQGTDLLLQAAQMLKDEAPDLHFLIMGYPGVDSYRELANYLGLEGRVTFPGRVPYMEAPNYLALGDIAVAPKMSATEGAGKITNYMAMGLPTVAFDTPVGRELLGNHGIFAEFGSARSLADKIKLLAQDDELRTSLGRSSREKAVNEMGLHHTLRQLEDIYAEVSGDKKAVAQPGLTRANAAADSSADIDLAGVSIALNKMESNR